MRFAIVVFFTLFFSMRSASFSLPLTTFLQTIYCALTTAGSRRPRMAAMKTTPALVLLTLLSFAFSTRANGGGAACAAQLEAPKVLSENQAEADQAIARLRELGPIGLEMRLLKHKPDLETMRAATPQAFASNRRWQRLRQAIDAVAQQKDAHASQLFWFTDLDQAKAEARRSRRPILSLRLLGKLNEDLSCANSRFFRTTLYANGTVAGYLRDHFVLHWESVRPAPRIEIDFGDGRKIVRTITGNSAHHILDTAGRPVDVVPGLYGARAFLRALEEAAPLALAVSEKDDAERAEPLSRWHQERADRAAARARELGAPEIAFASVRRIAPGISKRLVEVALHPVTQDRDPLVRAMDHPIWAAAAAANLEDAQLDESARALLRVKHPPAADAGEISVSKVRVEDPLLRAIRNLERSIAEDTLRNELLLHHAVHRWFAARAPETVSVGALNDRIYAELFLSPRHDPWLGLVPKDTISALDGEGLAVQR